MRKMMKMEKTVILHLQYDIECLKLFKLRIGNDQDYCGNGY